MTEEPLVKVSTEEAVMRQQYLRSLSSFEGIILSQIKVKNKLGDRLNLSIRTGLVILTFIAVSILVLLLMLSIQMSRISGIVIDMNSHFTSIATKMERITTNMGHMEHQVSQMEAISTHTEVMKTEMLAINGNMGSMDQSVTGITTDISDVSNRVGNIALTIHNMNNEVQAMSHEMHRMAKPARSINRMFPFNF